MINNEIYADEPPCHDLLEQGGFRKRQPYYRHHEGYGCAERNALCHEDLNDRHDAGSVGVHRHGAHDSQLVVLCQIGLEEAFGHIPSAC